MKRSNAARGRNERGVVIIVALLVVLALAGVAVLAAHRVSNEVDRSGNFFRNKQGAAVTWVGALASASLMERQGNTFMTAMRREGRTRMSLSRQSFDGGNVLDLEEGGSFDRAVLPQEADFRVNVAVFGEVDGAVAGYSVGEYRFSRVVMTTYGNFGSAAAAGGDVVDIRSAQNQVRAFLLIGPIAQGETPQ